MLRRVDRSELLDGPLRDHVVLRTNLTDLARLNRLFGGISSAASALSRLHLPDRPLTLLDVGTGAADVPVALGRRWQCVGRQSRWLCLDRSAQVLAAARRLRKHDGHRLAFVQASALHLPFADRAVDVSLCTLTLHHFTDDGATALLRELARVSRVGLVVIDLYRSIGGLAGAWLATHLLARSPMTRHDGPLSVLRASTPCELLDLAYRADLPRPTVRVHPWFRMSLVAQIDA